jgi:phenylacetate-CoA ligase
MYLELARALRLDRPALEELRTRRLRQVVRHAYDTVPYYRRLFDRAGVSPGSIQAPADLTRLPLTSKNDLRALPADQIVSTAAQRPLVPRMTSGSSGEPFQFYRSAEQQVNHLMVVYRSMRVNGLRWRDRLLCIGQTFYPWGTWPQKIGILPTRYVSPLSPVEMQLDALRRFRPTVLITYPSVARALASALVERGLPPPPLRRVFTVAEMLDAPTSDLIERVFGRRPLSLYGAYELARIGWQCTPFGPFHTADDLLVIEVLRDGRPVEDGETGELAITHLTNHEMPLIRYRLGDLGRRVPRSCACTHAFEQIELTEGRVSEVLALPDGTQRSPLRAAFAVHTLPGVVHFQLHHEHAGEIIVRVVAGPGYQDDTTTRLVRTLESLLPGMRVTVEQVGEIPRTAAGKLPYIVIAPELRTR